jgi:hypothetical protein
LAVDAVSIGSTGTSNCCRTSRVGFGVHACGVFRRGTTSAGIGSNSFRRADIGALVVVAADVSGIDVVRVTVIVTAEAKGKSDHHWAQD